jgi:hypothetical protein
MQAGPNPDSRRALELLAGSRDGMLADMIRAETRDRADRADNGWRQADGSYARAGSGRWAITWQKLKKAPRLPSPRHKRPAHDASGSASV